jgi:hypothetical protein
MKNLIRCEIFNPNKETNMFIKLNEEKLKNIGELKQLLHSILD